MSSKSKLNLNKSTLSETPNNKASSPGTTLNNKPTTPNHKGVSAGTLEKKASPATPRVSKLSRGVTKSESDSPSPLQSSRLSVDRSPRSVTSKPLVDRPSPKVTTTPDKQPPRVLKGSELQAKLNLAEEECKKANEKLALVEKEKAQAIDELKEAQRLAVEANGKLTEALVAQKRAEDDCEIEKFRAVELEQTGIEASQKKEDEWQKELEAVRNQHALDVSALLSATQELQKVKQELAMTCDAKKQALNDADDATKIAQIHAEKLEIMSTELTRLKAMLDSRIETEANDNNKMVLELISEVETLKQELDKAKDYETEAKKNRKLVLELKSEVESLEKQLEKAKDYAEKLAVNEASLEQLNVELEAAKMAEYYSHNLVGEWQKRVEELEAHAEQANRLERSASESLESIMKQLQGSNDLLHDAESEIGSLKEKVGLLEMSAGLQRGNLEELERSLSMAKEEACEMEKKFESLTSELDSVKEEKTLALNNEKVVAASVQSLLVEKNELINELETSRAEEEKSKKAMESLASALHEVSSEAREAKEKLLSSQDEHENLESQIKNLNLVLEASSRKYEGMHDDAKHEIGILTNLIEQSNHDHQNTKAEWEQKELHLMDCVSKSQEENSSMAKEVTRLVNLLKEAESEACALREAEVEVNYLKEVLGEAKAESIRVKESLLDKENELQSIIQDNKELRTKESDSLKKVEELLKLLEEAMTRKQAEENGELTDSEKDYDMLPKVIEFSEQNGDGKEENGKLELPPQHFQESVREIPLEGGSDVLHKGTVETGNGVQDLNGTLKEKEEDDSVEVEFKMWESCKIEDKDFSPERSTEKESVEELDSKADGNESFDQVNGPSLTENIENGGSSPTKEQSQKKKKPLFRKFGSLLKKKGTSSNQK